MSYNGTKGISPTSKTKVYARTDKHQTSGLIEVKTQLQKMENDMKNSLAEIMSKLKESMQVEHTHRSENANKTRRSKSRSRSRSRSRSKSRSRSRK